MEEWKCCWTKEVIDPQDCPYITDGEGELLGSAKKRVLEKCIECFRFRDDLQKLKEEDHPFAQVVAFILEEFYSQRAQIHSMAAFLDTKRREIRFLHELSVVLQTSMDLDEVLSVALTAITAGKGFGMNRAFLLLADKDRNYLKGYLGIGPRDFEEAFRTWEDISRRNFSLKEMARNFRDANLTAERAKFRDILDRLTIPLEDRDHVLNRSLRDRKPILLDRRSDGDNALLDLLGVDSLLVMPLISRKRRIGVIIADNCVTRKPITAQDMQSMETFAFAVAFAIERASLYEQLQEKVDKLMEANRRLKEQQELIVRMEKMALVGKITSGIAHSIRNPLMVIGGFARALLRNISGEDPNRNYLESIVREARQLDEVLEEALSYSDSLYPTMDMWDVNHLVKNVFQEFSDALEIGHITGALELAQDLPTAFIDYKQITFCVRNTLRSVVDSLPEGGALTVNTHAERENIVLQVEGAPSAEMRGGTLDPEHSLGLSLCRSILEKGGIPFDATSGGGRTIFTLKLPTERRE